MVTEDSKKGEEERGSQDGNSETPIRTCHGQAIGNGPICPFVFAEIDP